MSSFNTLDRDLSIRINHPNTEYRQSINNNSENKQNMSIQSNHLDLDNVKNQSKYKQNQSKHKQNQSKSLILSGPTQTFKTKLAIQPIKPIQSIKPIKPIKPIQSIELTQSNQQKQRKLKLKKSIKSLTLDRPMSSNIDDSNKKIKYIDTDNRNFKDYYSFGNKLGQNYQTDYESDLRYSESTRRKTLDSTTIANYKKSSIDTVSGYYVNSNSDLNTSDNELTRTTTIQMDRLGLIENNQPLWSIGSNIISNETSTTSAKIPKASAEYWDNTKRRNLDTSIYTNNPKKIQGKGFGDINAYDIFSNGVGVDTRQTNPEIKPQNIENDRIYLTNHNYNYDKHHVPEILPCGSDTRHLNKKVI